MGAARVSPSASPPISRTSHTRARLRLLAIPQLRCTAMQLSSSTRSGTPDIVRAAADLRWRSLSPAMIYPILDFFIPPSIQTENASKQRARMFLISHIFGPFLGHVITVYLFWLEPHPDHALWILGGSISAFWA